MKAGQDSASAIERWMGAEDWYIANLKPADFVDLVVSGERP